MLELDRKLDRRERRAVPPKLNDEFTQNELLCENGGNDECSIEVPPLDQVTIASSSESTTIEKYRDDCASTCSSITCDIAEVPSPRIIFGDYWNCEGRERLPFRRSIALSEFYVNYYHNDELYSLSSISPPPSSSIFQKDEEVLLKEAASVNPARGMKRTQARRSIFEMVKEEDEVEHEYGALVKGSLCSRQLSIGPSDMIRHFRECFRKYKSAPAFRPKSALRSGRFSFGKQRTYEVSNANEDLPSCMKRCVSFNEKVHVTVFEKPESSMPVAQWPGSGWSKWFG